MQHAQSSHCDSLAEVSSDTHCVSPALSLGTEALSQFGMPWNFSEETELLKIGSICEL